MHDCTTEAGGTLGAKFSRQRSSTRKDHLDRTEVVLVNEGVFGQPKNDRRYGEEPRDLSFLRDRECLFQIEARHGDDRDTICQQAVHEHLHAIDMEERQSCQSNVAFFEKQHMFHLCDVCREVAMCEHDTLAAACGA